MQRTRLLLLCSLLALTGSAYSAGNSISDEEVRQQMIQDDVQGCTTSPRTGEGRTMQELLSSVARNQGQVGATERASYSGNCPCSAG